MDRRSVNRLIAEWLVKNPLSDSKSDLTVGRLLDAYLEFVRQYYTDPEGNCTRSLPRCMDTAKKLNVLYHDTLAEQFTPTKLRVFKKHLIAKNLCRRSVNHILVMVRRIF